MTNFKQFREDWPEVAYRPGRIRGAASVLFWLCAGFFVGVFCLAVVSVIQGV